MVVNKLSAIILAEAFLLVVAGFAVSLYILPTATGTANGILSFHTSNIPCLRSFLFARRLSAYILGHHPVPEWMPQLLVSLIWTLTFITGKMDDKDKADTRLYKILDSLLICVFFPLMLWSIAAVFNH